MPKEDPVQRALALLSRMIEAKATEELLGGPLSHLEITLAAEMYASVCRRTSRDLGIAKDSVQQVRMSASRVAGELYEASGMGRQVRAHAAAVTDSERAEARLDGPVDPVAWDAAGRVMGDFFATLRPDKA